MSNFLDNTGLAYFWGKIKSLFLQKTDLSNTISNDSTKALTPKAVYDAGYLTSYTETIPTGYCETAAGVAKKDVIINYGYRDDPNYWVCVFRYANTADNATISINSYATTELPIYVNGERTSATNTFGAGVILFLYYNNAYWCYNDGRFPIVSNETGEVISLQEELTNAFNDLALRIPTTISQLYNDSGYLTSETDPTVPSWAKQSTKPTYTAAEVGALPDTTVILDEKLKVERTSDNGTYYPIISTNSTDASTKLRSDGLTYTKGSSASLTIGNQGISDALTGKLVLTKYNYTTTIEPSNNGAYQTITLPNASGTVALTSDVPQPYSSSNTGGYLTMATLPIYDGRVTG